MSAEVLIHPRLADDIGAALQLAERCGAVLMLKDRGRRLVMVPGRFLALPEKIEAARCD